MASTRQDESRAEGGLPGFTGDQVEGVLLGHVHRAAGGGDDLVAQGQDRGREIGGTTDPVAESGSWPAWMARVEKPCSSVMLATVVRGTSLGPEQPSLGTRCVHRWRAFLAPCREAD